jgi:hypothetical protein
VDAANGGGEGPPSNVGSWTFNVPNLTAAPPGNGVAISWTAVNGADHYNVYANLTGAAYTTCTGSFDGNGSAYTYVSTVNGTSTTLHAGDGGGYLVGGQSYGLCIWPVANVTSHVTNHLAEGWPSGNVNVSIPLTNAPTGVTVVTTCIVNPFTNVVNWTAPSASAVTGYVLNRSDPWGQTLSVTLPPTQLVYTDGATTNNRTYVVTALNGQAFGPPSNASAVAVCPPQTFLGIGNAGGGSIYGGPNVRASAASALGLSVTTLDALFGMWWIMIFTALGYFVSRRVVEGGHYSGAVVGAVLGFFFDFITGLLPVWFYVMIAVAGIAAGGMWLRNRPSGGGEA